MPWRFQSVLLSVFTLIETIYPEIRQKCPRMQNVYFGLTCVSQKRVFLSSPASLSKQEHIWFPSNLNIFSTIQSRPALRTPRYYRQFALSLGKESPYILSKFNQLNMDIFYGPLSVCITVDCKTVRIFAYSSTCEQSNKRSGTRQRTNIFSSRLTRPTGMWSSPRFTDFLTDFEKKTDCFAV